MENDDTRFYHDEETVIVDYKPEDGEVVDVTSDVEVYFTRDINVNTLDGNFHVVNKSNGNSVPGSFDYDKNNSKVIYEVDLLEENTPYEVYIDGVEDLSGAELPEFSFEFRTNELEILDKHPPQIVEPTNNTVVEEPKIAWTTFNDYDGNYDLEVSTDARFTNLVYSVETSETEIKPNIEYGKTYHARVKYNDNISESLARETIEINSTSDDLNYVYFENYFEYDYGNRLYSISSAYIKSGEYLDIVDSGQSDKGDVYINPNQEDKVIIDKKLNEEDIIVIDLYHYVESERKWSNSVSFYVKDLEYGDLDSIFEDDNASSKDTNFIQIVEPKEEDLVSPNIDSIRLRINSDMIEKEDIDINITGIANDMPEFQHFAEEEKVEGSIENFIQKNGYTEFDFVFKYKDKGDVRSFIVELKDSIGSINSFNTSKYSHTGQVNNLTTLIIESIGSTNNFTTSYGIDDTEPYSVRNYNDLERIGTGDYGWTLDSNYIQENDIDCSGNTIEPIALNDSFTGSYDGQGNTISNFNVNEGTSYAGLFSENNGTIKNLVIDNASINTTIDNSGILIGYNGTSGVIEKIGVENSSITGVNRVGGLIGTNSGQVLNSYTQASIEGEDHLGGVIGMNSSSNVGNIYSASDITSSLTSPSYIGGLAGESTEYLDSNTCFWDTDVGPNNSSNGGDGLPTTDMQDYYTYDFWDIDFASDKNTPSTNSIWSIVDGESYPFLF